MKQLPSCFRHCIGTMPANEKSEDCEVFWEYGQVQNTDQQIINERRASNYLEVWTSPPLFSCVVKKLKLVDQDYIQRFLINQWLEVPKSIFVEIWSRAVFEKNLNYCFCATFSRFEQWDPGLRDGRAIHLAMGSRKTMPKNTFVFVNLNW